MRGRHPLIQPRSRHAGKATTSPYIAPIQARRRIFCMASGCICCQATFLRAPGDNVLYSMKILFQNALAIFVGLALGAGVNMSLIMVGPHLIPPPAGVDVTDVESIEASIHLFGPRHFVFPFLAHALGTLVGALAAFLIAASHRDLFAYAIGLAFLIGGIMATFMIPAPAWYIVLDLVAAYLPMAWIGTRLGRRIKKGKIVERA